MTDEEKKNISSVMWDLHDLLDEMDENWDDEDPISESDYIRWREAIIKAYDILLELRER